MTNPRDILKVDIFKAVKAYHDAMQGRKSHLTLQEVEGWLRAAMLQNSLKKNKGNMCSVAKVLGVNRKTASKYAHQHCYQFLQTIRGQ